MGKPRALAAAIIGVLAWLVGVATELQADQILDVIDIRPVIARHDIGNALGLAFNPGSNVLYLAHGSDPRGGFIYTLAADGSLLDELDLQSVYRPGAFPVSLSFDRSTGHLFVLIEVPVGQGFVSHLVEIDPDTAAIFSDRLIDIDGGGGIHVRVDGVWQARFSEDIIRHYTRGTVFIEDLSVSNSFPGFPGPFALTSSFAGGGFIIVDLFGRRLVEIDISGNEVAAVSTASLGDGRGLAIDSDIGTRRIFLQVNNEAIYVLSSAFIGAVSIDIKPGSSRNAINPKSKGKISVAILTTDTFDATMVSSTTIRFGRTGTEAAPVHVVTRDVNADGLTDLVPTFNTESTEIRCGDTSASLTGETIDGQAIHGTDAIVTVGCNDRQ